MSREINLVSYLPEFMQQYKEPVATLDAEKSGICSFYGKKC